MLLKSAITYKDLLAEQKGLGIRNIPCQNGLFSKNNPKA